MLVLGLVLVRMLAAGPDASSRAGSDQYGLVLEGYEASSTKTTRHFQPLRRIFNRYEAHISRTDRVRIRTQSVRDPYTIRGSMDTHGYPTGRVAGWLAR